jgi:hypothetical protein
MRYFGIYAHDVVIHGGHTLVQGTNDTGHAFDTACDTSKNKFKS